jgi:hypothetical protein
MKTQALFLILAIGLGLSACKKDDDTSPLQNEIIAVFDAAQFAQNPCQDATIMKSASGPATTVYFKNETDVALRIYWINQLGTLTLYENNLKAGEGRKQPTYLTHPWYIVTADTTEQCITIVTALRPAVTDTVYFKLK